MKELSMLPTIYNGNMNQIIKKIKILKKKYPLYTNFLDNYFVVNKSEYFKDVFYQKIPKDCRTNNYLENCDGFIKLQLDKHRIIT